MRLSISPHGGYRRRVDPEHPAGLLGSETQPLDEDQGFPLAAWELRERPSDVMARRHRPTEVLGRNSGEDPASPDPRALGARSDAG